MRLFTDDKKHGEDDVPKNPQGDNSVTTELDGIQRTLGNIEGKLDSFITREDERNARLIDLEKRVNVMEKRQHWYAGAAAGVGAIFTAFAGSWVKPPLH